MTPILYREVVASSMSPRNRVAVVACADEVRVESWLLGLHLHRIARSSITSFGVMKHVIRHEVTIAYFTPAGTFRVFVFFTRDPGAWRAAFQSLGIPETEPPL